MARALGACVCLVAACSLVTDTDDLAEDAVGADASITVDAAPAADAPALPIDAVASDGAVSNPDGAVVDGGAADAQPIVDAGSGYPSLVKSDQPIAYFRFEEAADVTTAFDEVRQIDVPIDGPVTYQVAGAFGKGIQLAGTAELELGDVFDFAGLTEFTLEAWTKTKPNPMTQQLFVKRGGTPLTGYIFYSSGTSAADAMPLNFEFWGVQLNVATTTFAEDAFKHLAVVVSYEAGAGTARIYENGQPIGASAGNNTNPQPDTPYNLLIGHHCFGVLDEVAIYARALPADRVLAHAQATR